MPTRSRPARARLLLAGSVAVYLGFSLALIAVGPGPHYDEALFQAGAVHMLTDPGPPSFTQPSYGWFRCLGRAWPLMMMPYVGAVSYYLFLPVFAVWGPGIVVGRVVAGLLGALGLGGMGRLTGAIAGSVAAAAVVLVLAVHPGYSSTTGAVARTRS